MFKSIQPWSYSGKIITVMLFYYVNLQVQRSHNSCYNKYLDLSIPEKTTLFFFYLFSLVLLVLI